MAFHHIWICLLRDWIVDTKRIKTSDVNAARQNSHIMGSIQPAQFIHIYVADVCIQCHVLATLLYIRSVLQKRHKCHFCFFKTDKSSEMSRGRGQIGHGEDDTLLVEMLRAEVSENSSVSLEYWGWKLWQLRNTETELAVPSSIKKYPHWYRDPSKSRGPYQIRIRPSIAHPEFWTTSGQMTKSTAHNTE